MRFLLLLFLFVAVPVAEVWLLFRIAAWLGEGGGLLTVGLVIVTGSVGAALAKRQGAKVLRAIRDDLAAGRMPTDHLISGALVLAGGLLLVTPGVMTDCLGLLLLIPGNRRLLIPPLRSWCGRHVQAHITVTGQGLPGMEREAEAKVVPGEET